MQGLLHLLIAVGLLGTQAPESAIDGRLVDPNGVGRPGVRIVAERGSVIESVAWTGREGSFALDGLAAGTYRVVARLGDFPATNVAYPGGLISLSDGEVVEGLEFRTDSPVQFEAPPPPSAPPSMAEVTGRVMMESGGPVPRVTLAMTEDTGDAFDNTRDAFFVSQSLEINDLSTRLSVGRYQVRFRDLPEGYAIVEATVTSAAGATDLLVEGTLDLDSGEHEILVRVAGLEEGYTVAGRVVDAESGDPASSGRIRLLAPGLRWLDTEIGPDGRFRFPLVFPGRYAVRLHEGVELSSTVIDVDQDLTDLVIERPRTVAVWGQMEGAGSEAVDVGTFVFDLEQDLDSPVPETVRLTPDGRSTQTLIEGTYRAVARSSMSLNVPVAILDGGRDLFTEAVELRGRSYVALDVVPAANSRAGPQGLAIEGRVIGRTKGVSQVRVGSSLVTVDTDGRFRADGLAPGAYYVSTVPGRPGVEIVPAVIVLDGSDVTDVRVIVPPEVELGLELAVEFPTGEAVEPLPTIGVEAGRAPSTQVRVGGGSTIRLFPGIYPIRLVSVPASYRVVSATAGAVDLLSDPLLVTPEATPPTIRVVLETDVAGAGVEGRVTGNESARQVHLNAPGFAPSTADLAPDGSFFFPRVIPGRYSIHATPGPIMAGAHQVVVGEGGLSDVEVVVPPEFTVLGRVDLVEAEGLPLMSARLREDRDVRISFSNGGASIGRDGAFEIHVQEGEYAFGIDGVPPGYFVTSVQAGDLDLRTAPLRVGPGTPDVLVTLAVTDPPPWRRVSGNVSGLPPGVTPPFEVRLQGDSASTASAMIGPDGSFVFDRLLPRTYTVPPSFVNGGVTLVDPGAIDRPATITVSDSDIDGVALVVRPTAFVEGTATVEGPERVPRYFLGSRYRWGNSGISSMFSPIGSELPVGPNTLDVNNFPDAFEVRSLVLSGPDPSIDLIADPQVELVPGEIYEVRAEFERRAGFTPIRLEGRISGLPHRTDREPYLTLAGPDIVYVPVTEGGLFEAVVAPGRYQATLSWLRDSPTHVLLTLDTEYAVLARGLVIDPETSVLELKLPPQIDGRIETTDRSETDLLRLRVTRGTPPASDAHMVGEQFTLFAEDGDSIAVDEGPFGYEVASITYGGRDIADQPLTVGSGPEELVVLLAPLPFHGGEFSIEGRVDGWHLPDRSVFVRLWEGIRRLFGAVPSGGRVRLQAHSPSPYAVMFTRIARDGGFRFDRIPPGTYDLTVPDVPQAARVPARVVVTGSDVGGVILHVPEWRAATGRVTMADGSRLPDLSGAFLVTRNRWTFEANRFSPDGSFGFTIVDEVGNDRTRSVFGLPSGYAIESTAFDPSNPDALAIVLERVLSAPGG